MLAGSGGDPGEPGDPLNDPPWDPVPAALLGVPPPPARSTVGTDSRFGHHGLPCVQVAHGQQRIAQAKAQGWDLGQDRTFHSTTVKGPPNFKDWAASWKVLRKILLGWGALG